MLFFLMNQDSFFFSFLIIRALFGGNIWPILNMAVFQVFKWKYWFRHKRLPTQRNLQLNKDLKQFDCQVKLPQITNFPHCYSFRDISILIFLDTTFWQFLIPSSSTTHLTMFASLVYRATSFSNTSADKTNGLNWTLCRRGPIFTPQTIHKMKLSHSLEQAPLWDLNNSEHLQKASLLLLNTAVQSLKPSRKEDGSIWNS